MSSDKVVSTSRYRHLELCNERTYANKLHMPRLEVPYLLNTDNITKSCDLSSTDYLWNVICEININFFTPSSLDDSISLANSCQEAIYAKDYLNIFSKT